MEHVPVSVVSSGIGSSGRRETCSAPVSLHRSVRVTRYNLEQWNPDSEFTSLGPEGRRLPPTDLQSLPHVRPFSRAILDVFVTT